MAFDGISFFNDYGITYTTTGKNVSSKAGWVGLQCVFCNDHSDHLGFNIYSGQFTCWKCGPHSQGKTVSRLTGESERKAHEILREYGGGTKQYFKHEKKVIEKDIDVSFPAGTLDYFPKRHIKYLESRNFDPKEVIETWGLRATGKLGRYSNRIIAPVTHKNVLVSYYTRTILKNEEMRYMPCLQKLEKREHKHCLYGLDKTKKKSVLVVEGMTDTWRMGVGAVGLFGTSFTDIQVMLLYQNFENVFVCFDPEAEAQQKAQELVLILNTMGKHAENITHDQACDPGDLSQEDADYMMRELLLR